jgi:hypothetical protein
VERDEVWSLCNQGALFSVEKPAGTKKGLMEQLEKFDAWEAKTKRVNGSTPEVLLRSLEHIQSEVTKRKEEFSHLLTASEE